MLDSRADEYRNNAKNAWLRHVEPASTTIMPLG